MFLLNRRKYFGVKRNPEGALIDIADAVVTVAERVQYTGSPCMPSVSVVYDGVTLVANTDYFVAYNDNVNPGAATVVVTGTGSFTGTAVKTFQIVIDFVGGWDFDVADLTLEGYHNLGSGLAALTNPQSVMPFVNLYDKFLVPVHQWSSDRWIVGYFFPTDTDGEFHLANILDSGDGDKRTLDTTAGDGNYRTPFYFDYARSGWISSDDTKTIRVKYSNGTPSSFYDFTGWLSEVITPLRRPFFADEGRILFLPGSYMKVSSVKMSEPYNLFTIDISTFKVVEHAFDINLSAQFRHGVFSPDGKKALVCTTNNKLYQASLESPYDFTGASLTGEANLVAGCRSLTLANGGKTLFVGVDKSVYEYNLVA